MTTFPSLRYHMLVCLWVVVILSGPLVAAASRCSMVSSAIHDAREKLRRSVNAMDLEEAQDAARRAKNALDDAAQATRDCGCHRAASEFDDAATRARRARDAADAEEFVDNLNRAIQAFNAALAAMQTCRSGS